MNICFSRLFLGLLLVVPSTVAKAAPSSEIDLEREFLAPPVEHHTVPCWWWDGGDPVRDDRVDWQLEKLHSQGLDVVCLSQVGPHGVRPPVLTEDWWDRVEHVVEKAASLNMKVWVVDGIGWGSPMTNNLVADADPAFRGLELQHIQRRVTGPARARLEIQPAERMEEVIGAYAYRVTDDHIGLDGYLDLSDQLEGRKLFWEAPAGEWMIVIMYSRLGEDQSVPIPSPPHAFGRGQAIDYTNPAAMQKLIEVSIGEYERRFPEHMGKTIVANFQDELLPSQGFPAISNYLFREFEKRKGYDLKPYLVGLYNDVGRMTPKIRCDYFDVWVSLMEEAFFIPEYDWYEKRGLRIAHDQFGRQSLIDGVVRYGDYFRTMRWYQMPGSDDWYEARLGRNFRDIKMASSIAHLYERPKVFCEALHSAGWGLTIADQQMVVNEEYVLGVNLYDEILFNYTTYGSWFEFAPAGSMFRQPYFRHKHLFNQYVNRLSAVMSHGVHVANVAIFYPVHSLQAALGGRGGDDTAELIHNTYFQLGETIFDEQIDFDFIDDSSIQRADTSAGRLDVAGESYGILVLPPLTTISRATLEKIEDFNENGGTVIATTLLPDASPESGGEDPQVANQIESIFGSSLSQLRATRELVHRKAGGSGHVFFLPTEFRRVAGLIKDNHQLDLNTDLDHVLANHRRVGKQDLYLLFNASTETLEGSVTLRATGRPQLWDIETGEMRDYHRFRARGDTTRLDLSLGPRQAELIVLTRGEEGLSVAAGGLSDVTAEEKSGRTFLSGWADSPGHIQVAATRGQTSYTATAHVQVLPDAIEISGNWDFGVEPTMDNTWGDFRRPVSPDNQMIGAEVRQFLYRQEDPDQDGISLGWQKSDLDTGAWKNTIYSVGPYWWVIRPFPTRGAVSYFDNVFVSEPDIDLTATYRHRDRVLRWEPYSFSQIFGIHKDPRYYGLFGLAHYNHTYADFIDLGDSQDFGIAYAYAHVYSPRDMRALLKTDNGSYMEPMRVWVNKQRVSPKWGLTHMVGTLPVDLKEGWNEVLVKLLRLNRDARFYVHLEPYGSDAVDSGETEPGPRLPWFASQSPFIYDLTPEAEKRVGWYRFELPPGASRLHLDLYGKARAFVDGFEVPVEENGTVDLEQPAHEGSICSLRIDQEQGRYAGAAFRSPVRLDITQGSIQLGDWSQKGLLSYSGIGVYTTTVEVPAFDSGVGWDLDLGEVRTSAEVEINGEDLGARAWSPYRFDAGRALRQGKNIITVRVANTLANHGLIGTGWMFVYEGTERSGLIGPVTLHPRRRVSVPLQRSGSH